MKMVTTVTGKKTSGDRMIFDVLVNSLHALGQDVKELQKVVKDECKDLDDKFESKFATLDVRLEKKFTQFDTYLRDVKDEVNEVDKKRLMNDTKTETKIAKMAVVVSLITAGVTTSVGWLIVHGLQMLFTGGVV